ncbi:MAG: hypothetical protein CML68_16590 [Rhodobacteraceae bacterium]|nr:hypothetical protein [Paracoccaceae bacterium]
MPAAGPGKSGQSVGHQAKATVAAAKEAGIEPPKNAQGLAASQIARGVEAAMIFTAPEPPVSDPPVADPPVSDPADPVSDGSTASTDTSGADTALILLTADAGYSAASDAIAPE